MKKLLLVLLVLSTSAFAQNKIKTLEIRDTTIFTTVDRPGDLYIISKQGQFQKFDESGSLVAEYKSKVAPTLFDPRNGARLFAYYRDTQHYEYFNPTFELTASYTIDSAFVIQPWLACPSGEYKLWILDAEDRSLKKINIEKSQLEVEVVIDAKLINDATTITFMREYQGFVFLLNPKKGIYVFNSLGKHIKTIEAHTPYFNFIGEELYYVKDTQLYLFDLFTAETRTINIPSPAQIALLTNIRLFAIQPGIVEIIEFKL